MKKRAKSGFSLVETLVVVAIIGILMALYLPTIAKALRKAKEISVKEGMRQEHMGRMADNANSPTQESQARPGRDEARAAFRQELALDHGDKMIYSELLYAVTNDDEFEAYYKTLLDPSNNTPLQWDPNGGLMASNDSQTFTLRPLETFANTREPLPKMWESISTVLTDTTSGTLGGNVLYTDGHIEYVKYPAAFPMTHAVAKRFHEFLAS